MSEQVISCPGCGKRLRIRNASPGQEIICPNCGQHFRLRGRAAPPNMEDEEEELYGAEDKPRRKKRRKSSQSAVLLIVVGAVLGLGITALAVAFIVSHVLENRQGGQAQAGVMAPGKAAPGGKPNIPAVGPGQPIARPPDNTTAANPASSSSSSPVHSSAPNLPGHANPLGGQPGATRHEAIVERIWLLADSMWEAFIEAKGSFPGTDVQTLLPHKAEQFAKRMEPINKELLSLINEAKTLPEPDAKLRTKLYNLNDALFRKLLRRHNIRIFGSFGPGGDKYFVPTPDYSGPALGPERSAAAKALSEFDRILSLGPDWTPK